VKVLANCTVLASVMVAVLIGPGHAQQATKPRNTPARTTAAPPPADAAPAAAPSQPGWSVGCTSAGRAAPLECAMEQTAVLTKTGQLVVMVNVRVPSDTHVPIILAQLPLGLNLPGGIKLQVDDGKTADLQIQTCENRGCFASSQIGPDLLTALQSGKQLKLSFQNLSKEAITIPMPLNDFAVAYDKIK
jgi:invasion protein IalB